MSGPSILSKSTGAASDVSGTGSKLDCAVKMRPRLLSPELRPDMLGRRKSVSSSDDRSSCAYAERLPPFVSGPCSAPDCWLLPLELPSRSALLLGAFVDAATSDAACCRLGPPLLLRSPCVLFCHECTSPELPSACSHSLDHCHFQ